MGPPSLPAFHNGSREWHSCAVLSHFAYGCCLLGLAIVPVGCAEFRVSHSVGVVVAGASGREQTEPPAPVAVQHLATAACQAADERKIAIDLEAVFRLAEDQNAQVSLARARVQEAGAAKDIAATSWLPT